MRAAARVHVELAELGFTATGTSLLFLFPSLKLCFDLALPRVSATGP